MPRRPKLPAGHGLYWHPKTGIIWTRFRVRGQECRRSCSTRDPGAAAVEARRLRLEAEQDRDVGRSRRGARRLEDLAIEDVLEHRRRGVPALYCHRLESQCRVALRNLGDVLGGLGRPPEAGDVTYTALRAYEGLRRVGVATETQDMDRARRVVWRDRPARGQTIVREIRCIRRWLIIAKRDGDIAKLPEPWPAIRRDPKDKRRSGKLWPPQLLAQFLRGLHEHARDEVEVAVLTGLRLYELKRVEAGWVEPAPVGARTPAILRLPDWATKGGVERVIGLPASALATVKRRLEADPKRERVFSQSNFKKHRATVARKLGWPAPPSMRDLRHTFASLSLRRTADAAGLLRALGHKDLRTTEMYLSSTIEDITAMGAAVEEAFAEVQGWDHRGGITDGTAAAETAASAQNHLERAKRLELSTLSLGSAGAGAKWLQSLASMIDAERSRAPDDAARRDHRVGSPRRRGGAGRSA